MASRWLRIVRGTYRDAVWQNLMVLANGSMTCPWVRPVSRFRCSWLLDIDESVCDDDLLRWHEEELMRQLGLI